MYWPVGHPEMPPINFEPLTPIGLDNNPIAYLMLFRNCIFWAKYIKFDSLQCLEEILAVRYHIWTVVIYMSYISPSGFFSIWIPTSNARANKRKIRENRFIFAYKLGFLQSTCPKVVFFLSELALWWLFLHHFFSKILN